MNQKIKVNKDVEGKRLDLGIALLCAELSRTQIKKIIESNNLKVNGYIEYRGNYKLKEGDIIEFEYNNDSPQYSKILPQNIPINILYEDDDLLVINKPSGMVAHPATGNWTGTVMNALLWKYKDMEQVGDSIRSGLIHRIDKDTSGILLIGKSNKALWHYSKLFAQRFVQKEYVCIVKGNIAKLFEDSRIFNVKNYIGRHPTNRKKMAVVGSIDSKFLPPDARISETELEYVSSTKEYSILIARPKTGRTHQIRVHLLNLGFPILGDAIYSKISDNRLYLHAYKIQIRHIDGHELNIIAPLPVEFVNKSNLYGLNIDKLVYEK